MLYAIDILYAYYEHRYNDDKVIVILDGHNWKDMTDNIEKIMNIQDNNDCMHYPMRFFAEDIADIFGLAYYRKTEEESVSINEKGVYIIGEKQHYLYGSEIRDIYAYIDDQMITLNIYKLSKVRDSSRYRNMYSCKVSEVEAEKLELGEIEYDQGESAVELKLNRDDLYDARMKLKDIPDDRIILEYGEDSYILDMSI